MPGLWVVAPVFNEERSLRSFVSEWIRALRSSVGGNFVFCLINDGSTDGSLEIMKDMAGECPEILVLDQANAGHGSACLSGYRMATDSGADWIFQIDSDGQCDPSSFDFFWRARSTGPVQYGYREGREDGPGRRLISKLLAALVFMLSLRWIRDPNVPYRLMSRESLIPALNRIPQQFGMANVLLSLLQAENPGISWHKIIFRKRPGRQNPIRITFFFREALRFGWSFLLWILRGARTDPMDAVVRSGRLLLSVSATYYFLVFLALAFLRVGAFVEYSSIESANAVQVHRVLAGQPIYTAPSLEYVPFLYPPLYIYASSVVSLLLGNEYLALRLVSAAATMGTMILIWRLVLQMSGSAGAAWTAVGLFSAMYRVAGFAYDIGRSDALFVFLTLAAAYCIWRANEGSGRSAGLAAAAAVAAVLTKQTALVPVLALSLWSLSAGHRQGRRAGLFCLGAVIVSQFLALAPADGWPFYYLYRMPLAHPLSRESIHVFLRWELLRRLSIGAVLSIWVIGVLYGGEKRKRKALFCLLLLLGLTAAALGPRFKIGGGTNNIIPLAAALAICCGLAVGLSLKMRKRASMLVLALMSAFVMQLFYFPQNGLPSKQAPMDLKMKVDLFRSLQQPVFAPLDPHISTLAGKKDWAFWGAIFDVWLTPGEPGEKLREELRKAFEDRKFRTVVLRKKFFMQSQFPYAQLERYYRPATHLEGTPSGWEEDLSATVFVPR